MTPATKSCGVWATDEAVNLQLRLLAHLCVLPERLKRVSADVFACDDLRRFAAALKRTGCPALAWGSLHDRNLLWLVGRLGIALDEYHADRYVDELLAACRRQVKMKVAWQGATLRAGKAWSGKLD